MGCDDRTKSNGFQLEDGRLKLNIRKKLFIVSMVKHWYRLPKEAVDIPTLETF